MKAFIEYLIRHLVDKPDEVKVNEITSERTAVFEVRVGNGDMGKVIGRKGQTARSLRTLLIALSAKQGKRAVLEILDPERIDQKNSQHKGPVRKIADRKPVPESQSNARSRWQDDGGNNL